MLAAFKSKDGRVQSTGNIHNPELLPNDFEIESEGFIEDDGSYCTREEETQKLHADHQVQSQELIKMQPPASLPKLGIENRRETPIINSVKGQNTKFKLMQSAVGAGRRVSLPKATSGTKIAGITGPAQTGTAMSFASGSNPKATQMHEDLHMMFNRVQNKFGKEASQNLASNLYHAIPEENRKHIRTYVKHIFKDKEPPSSKWHEEHLAYLLSYLNSPGGRKDFHAKNNQWDHNLNSLTPEGQEFNVKMKQAHRHLQNAASKADTQWLDRFIHKSEVDLLQKSMEWQPSEAEIELALDMLHAFHDDLLEFKAAKFLANGYQPSQEDIENALRESEGDYETAALIAHKIPVNEENARTLRKLVYVMRQKEELSKTELDTGLIPHVVKPFDHDSEEMAKVVKKAYEQGEVHTIKLNGKHSAGVSLVRDLDSGQLILLKPSSGKLSPALGIKEEKANMSRREVAFNKIAQVLGLGNYTPQAELLLLDNQEVAALQFFSQDFKPVEKLKRNHLNKIHEIFDRMSRNGLLMKFAVLDFIGGSADRHAGNIMINLEGKDVKLIDAGSTFAGPSYNPAVDKHSFVPYYLRVFVGDRKFSVLTPKERYQAMPKLTEGTEIALKYWIDNLPEGKIVQICNNYGINADYVVERLNKLKTTPGLKSDFIYKFYTGYEG